MCGVVDMLPKRQYDASPALLQQNQIKAKNGQAGVKQQHYLAGLGIQHRPMRGVPDMLPS